MHTALSVIRSGVVIDEELYKVASPATKRIIDNIEELTTLDLSGEPTPDNRNDIPALAEALRHNTTVMSLYLDGIGLGSLSAESIASMLQTNQTLQVIDINNNSITDYGASAIFDSLVTNTSVIKLSVGRSAISDNAAMSLANMLRTNTTLQQIEVFRNEIGNEGAVAIADALRGNSTLQGISLANNSIGNVGAQAILDMLAVNRTLSCIDLRQNNDIDGDLLDAIYSRVVENVLRTLALVLADFLTSDTVLISMTPQQYEQFVRDIVREKKRMIDLTCGQTLTYEQREAFDRVQNTHLAAVAARRRRGIKRPLE